MNTRIRVLRGVAAAVATTALAACADMPTAASPRPQTLQPDAVSAPAFTLKGTTEVPLVTANDTTYGTFTVSPRKSAVYMIGERRAIVFPAKAICEPATSSYGVGAWNDRCTPTRRDITVSFKSYYTEGGLLRIDFSPALRFNPLTEGVYLAVDEPTPSRDLSGLLDLGAWLNEIYYCPDDGACVDESLTDPTLKTVYDWKHDVLLRRVKHFSGYLVSIGRSGASVY